jgi:hypothetical protein
VHSNIVFEPITASAEAKIQFILEYISHLSPTKESVDDCRSSLRLMQQYFQPNEDIPQDSRTSKKRGRMAPQARVQKTAAAFQPVSSTVAASQPSQVQPRQVQTNDLPFISLSG